MPLSRHDTRAFFTSIIGAVKLPEFEPPEIYIVTILHRRYLFRHESLFLSRHRASRILLRSTIDDMRLISLPQAFYAMPSSQARPGHRYFTAAARALTLDTGY